MTRNTSPARPEPVTPHESGQIIRFPRPYIAPARMVEATRDYSAGWSPIDPPRAVGGDAAEQPLSSELRGHAGADHAPGPASRECSAAIDPDEQLKHAVFDEIRDGLLIVGYGLIAGLLFVAILLWSRG